MPLITTRQDKAIAIDTLELVLIHLAFPGLSETDRQLTMTHLAAMKADSRDLDVKVQLASDEIGKTVCQMTFVFNQRVTNVNN